MPSEKKFKKCALIILFFIQAFYLCRASQCEGQYCYITLTTAEMALDYDQNVDYIYDFAGDYDRYGDYGQTGLTGADYEASYGGKCIDKCSQSLILYYSFG